MSESTQTHLMNSKARTTLHQRAVRIKNARRTIPPTNTSPPKYWQVSSPHAHLPNGVLKSASSSCRVKDWDGTASNDKTCSDPSFSLKGWPNQLEAATRYLKFKYANLSTSNGIMPLRTPRQLFGVDPIRPNAILNARY
jgi:hypothetical protein